MKGLKPYMHNSCGYVWIPKSNLIRNRPIKLISCPSCKSKGNIQEFNDHKHKRILKRIETKYVKLIEVARISRNRIMRQMGEENV